MNAVGLIWGCLATALMGIGGVCLADARHADVAHGAVVAAQGTAAGASACAQCHGFEGISDSTGAFPRIAGQSAFYLAKQMRDFTSGVRTSAVMTPIAKALSLDDIADVAAYYAGVDSPYLPLPAPDPALVKRGEQLATVGDAAKNLPSCNNCHGPGGAGEPPAIPYLAGQYAHYTAFELQMWRSGFRKSSPEAMAQVARQLDENDIAAVAAYFQQVRSSAKAARHQKE
jgi:cytochrome c553